MAPNASKVIWIAFKTIRSRIKNKPVRSQAEGYDPRLLLGVIEDGVRASSETGAVAHEEPFALSCNDEPVVKADEL